jgi:molybdopterin molybdotransferase
MVHQGGMTATQRLPASLTALDTALAALLTGLDPVAAAELPLAEAMGCIAADVSALKPLPASDIAVADGWALRAEDIVGASSYSPVPLAAQPVWVEAGDAMPHGCNCVVEADLVDATGRLAQALGEAIPGQGVRRAGSDATQTSSLLSGSPVRPLDLLLARAAGLDRLKVRRARLRLLNVPGGNLTATSIAESASEAGAAVLQLEAASRDAESIAEMLDISACDLLVTIGGSGVGRHDATITALRSRGEVLAHGIAIQPGRTAATGRIGAVPFVALPGLPDQAFAAWRTLGLPLLDHLAGRLPRAQVVLPLARKIASSVGLAEIALLEMKEGVWFPLALADLPLAAIARADAWLFVPASSEGFAAGTPAGAYMLRERAGILG